MQNLLKTYQKRLTNLSSRNKSLLLMRTSKNFFFDFNSLDFALNKSAYDLLAEIFSSKKAVKICQKLDSRDEKSNALSSSLLQLFRTDQLIQAERGAMDLQIGFPYVKGKLNNENSIRCPLLFFPVRLIKGDKYWELERSGDIQFNSSFLLAYQQFNGVKLNDSFFEEDFQDLSKDIGIFLVELYEYLKNSPLELNFNSELFRKKIRHYESYTKEELELLEQGQLKLQPQAILGIFPQAGSFIAQDYTALLEQCIKGSTLESLFANHTNSEIKEKDLHLPLDVDASQEEVIKFINQGGSVVVQGPPGSGKSQLIANLMADYAAKGRKVLLVCQKRAALDMVYKRLKEIGMSNFAGLIHDFKSDRKELFEKIKTQIDSIENYRKENYNLDAIFLEREFNLASLQIEKICEDLESFKSALYDETKFGKSVKELYLLAASNSFKDIKAIDLREEAVQLNFNSLQNLKHSFEQINSYQEKIVHHTAVLWDRRKNAQSWTFTIKKELSSLISKAFEFKKQLDTYNIYEPKRRKEIFELIQNSQIHLESLFSPKTETEIIELEKTLQNYVLNEKQFSKFKNISVSMLFSELEKAISLQDSKLRFAWYKLTNKSWKHLQPWIAQSSLDAFRELILDFNKLKYLKEKYHFTNINDGKASLAQFKLIKGLSEKLRKYSINDRRTFTIHLELKNLYDAILESLQSYFEIDDLNFLLNLNESELQDFLNTKFDLLIGHDELVGRLLPIEKRIFEKTSNPQVAELSILLGFIEFLEIKDPLLQGVSSLKISHLENDLQIQIEKKRKLSKENLLIQLKETTYRYIDKNRLGNTTSYRELGHQVVKKRKIWPVRKILESFHEELFRLIPCWMASPETVSAIFPMEQYFDLVIFDEASQCFAENGLPAMLRGTQVLVAGDSKQLPPNDLYSVRFGEENPEEYLTEIDSLLSLCSQFLPNLLLSGHYRSKSLELIGFSNQHFYDNKLQLIPHFEQINSNDPTIEYLKVDGQWEKQQNKVEAEKIVAILAGIDPTKTVGVVTFNQPQAKLIQDLVEDQSVSIKNIENIQGDEFDVLIFSVAYAPDSAGKLRFQFGSLGLAGGENRLNVAITRAREKVIVVSSLFPDQLNVETATNKGPKLLKEYLAYAKYLSEGGKLKSTESTKKSFVVNLADKLKSENENLSCDLPFADLAVKSNGQYHSLILTDDNLLHQSIASKEAFGYFPLALKQKAWSLNRSWSRNYWLKLT